MPWHVPVTGPAEVPKFLGMAFTVKRNGRRVEQEQLHWWTVRDGKVARLRHFEDTAQVIAAWRG